MKKRLFLTLLLTIALFCIIAMTVSAESPKEAPAYDRTYNIDGVEYPIWEQDSEGNYHPLIWYLNSENKMCKVWADNQDTSKAPYVTYACYISNDSDAEIGTIRIYDENGTEYLTREKAVIANLNGVEITYNGRTSFIQRINQNAFNRSSLIRAAFLPKSINLMGPANGDQYKFSAFRECANLEYVEFPANSAITTIGNAAFYKCSSLKAISLPNNVTVIEPVAFQHCTSLQAVYLPDGFQKMMCNNATSGSFNNCTSMYFVDEPFVLNSTLSNIPEKESVYYFPSTLTGLGEGIRGCSNMNETLVVGTNYTSHSTSMYEGTGVKTVVYLGNMTYFWMTNTQSTKLNIVFAGSTSTPQVEVTGDQSAGTTIYLCKLNKYYNLNEKVWIDGTTHFEEISKTVITPSTSCTEPSIKTAFCFCDYEISNEPIEGTVSSHDYDYLNNDKAILVGIVYSNYSQNGEKTVICGNCGEQAILEAPALFTCLGYSASEDQKGGLSVGYRVNSDAIELYEGITGKEVSYGLFATTKQNIGSNDIIDSNGVVANGAVIAEFENSQFAFLYIKMFGFDTEDKRNAEIAIGAYVEIAFDGAKEYSYLQVGTLETGEKYCFVSYNDIAKKPSTDEEITQ